MAVCTKRLRLLAIVMAGLLAGVHCVLGDLVLQQAGDQEMDPVRTADFSEEPAIGPPDDETIEDPDVHSDAGKIQLSDDRDDTRMEGTGLAEATTKLARPMGRANSIAAKSSKSDGDEDGEDSSNNGGESLSVIEPVVGALRRVEAASGRSTSASSRSSNTKAMLGDSSSTRIDAKRTSSALVLASSGNDTVMDPSVVLQYPPPGYDRRVPPKPWPVQVKIRWELMHLYSLDDDDGEAEMTTMTYMLWTDERLKYDEKLLQGLRMLETQCENIWYPELELTTVKDSKTLFNRCRVFPDGMILLKAQTRLEMHAGHDLAMFPFDGFDLRIFYEVETLNAEYVQLIVDKDWSPFYHDPIEESFVYSLGHFSGESVEDSHLKMETHRSSAYYVFAHYIPIMIVTYSSATTFLISPEDHAGRIGVFAGSVLALIGVNYVMVAEIPKSAHVLWINLLLAGEYLLVGFSLVLALFGSRKFEQAQHELEESQEAEKVKLLGDDGNIASKVNNGVKAVHDQVSRRCLWCLSFFPGRFSRVKQSAWWDLVCLIIFTIVYLTFHTVMFLVGIYAKQTGIGQIMATIKG